MYAFKKTFHYLVLLDLYHASDHLVNTFMTNILLHTTKSINNTMYNAQCTTFCRNLKIVHERKCKDLPKAKTHLYCPLRTNSLANIRADDADEQLLLVLNTGTPVRPNSEIRQMCIFLLN